MPYAFSSLNSETSSAGNINQINKNLARLDNTVKQVESETITKTYRVDENTQVIMGKTDEGEYGTKVITNGITIINFGQVEGGIVGLVVGDISQNGIIYGKYRTNPDRYGTLHFQNGIPTQLEGQAPDDGRTGSWTVKPGENVITLLGG